MTNDSLTPSALSDAELIAAVKAVAAREREATARLVAFLAELDARRLYLAEACSSLFAFCTQVLRLSEHAAYGRIEAARAVRKFPVILELLADGSLHLTAVCLLSPHLTAENHQAVLASARHMSKREVEEIVAALRPRPAVPSTVRKLPATAPACLNAATRHRGPDTTAEPVLSATAPRAEPLRHTAAIKPLAPEQYKVQFTASRDTYEKLKLAQDLMRHTTPSGDIALIVDRALTLLVAELQKAKHAATRRPRTPRSRRSRGRHIPAHVKREVWARDAGQCAFVSESGRRCSERSFLEFHHRVPFADGGEATGRNIELRCRAHNAHEAKNWFGPREEDLVREAPPPLGLEWRAGWT